MMMRRFWDFMAAVIIGIVAVNALLGMIRPYVGLIVIIVTLTMCGNYLYQRARNW